MSEVPTPSSRWPLAGKCLLVLLALLVTLELTNRLDGHDIVQAQALFAGQVAPWINALPALLLMLALLALTRKLALSLWLTTLGSALLYGVSALKMAALANPLTRQDFLLIGQVGGDSSLFMRYLPWGDGLVFVLLGAALVTVALIAWEPALLPRRRRIRLPLAGLGLALLLSLLAGFGPWRAVYASHALDYRPWEAASSNARRSGTIGNLMLEGLYAPSESALVNDPAPGRALFAAHRHAIAEWLRQPAPDVPPDIVIVQSESFFDPAILNGYRAADWVPNLRRLQKIGQHGDMQVPTFGGGTIRTEFEVLTGLPLAFFPQLHYPYLGLSEHSIPGLAHSLQHAGYETIAIHPNKGGFWNRISVFRRMGFDHFIDIESPAFRHAHRRGFYVSDHDLTNVILDQLKPSGPPRFVLAISMENHGPYRNVPIDKEHRTERDAIAVPTGVNGNGARMLRDYLLHQRDADHELGRLADALAKRSRPAILVFYGDHLPGLEDGYAAGFKNGKLAPEQSVPYLLVQPGHPQAAERRDLPAWMLGSDILATAGVHDDAWFALEQVLAPTLRQQNWQPEQELQRQLASLAKLRLHNELPSVDGEASP